MDGKVSQLKQESAKLNIPLSVITSKVIPGYLGSPKGVLQVATKQGFVALDGKLANGGKVRCIGCQMKIQSQESLVWKEQQVLLLYLKGAAVLKTNRLR